jgi:hydrogenase maturation protease
MVRVLIVGFGNPLRSDDGLGWHIAQQLSRELSRDDVQIVAAHQLAPEIAEAASRAERILFVDAAQGGAPGSLTCEQVLPAAASNRYSHELSPAAVLKLAKKLYGRCPPAHLLTIAGESFETGETMSAPVIAAIPALMARIRNLIDCDREQEAR